MPRQIIRKTHKIDAQGKAVGRLATEIALLLRGKNKPSFVPNQDEGDFVVVENASRMKFTGKKLEQKTFFRHSGYPGGGKFTKLSKLFESDSAKVLHLAVYGMLPKNKLRPLMIKRLKIEK